MSSIAVPSVDTRPTPTLFEQIQQRDWVAARQRLLEFPSDAEYRPPPGRNQVTLLHWSCLHRAPLDVIVLVVDANPDALLTQDSVGFTPLHTAIAQGGSEEVVVMLIQRGGIMGSSIQSPRLGSPLCLACRHGMSVTVLSELIKSNPAMATLANENGLKPSHMLWFDFERRHGYLLPLLHGVEAETGQGSSRKRSRYEISGNPEINELMERLSVLLRGIQQTDPNDIVKSSFICDIVESQPSLGNMSKFLQIAVVQRPEELSFRDERTGNFALHLAASMPRQPEFSHVSNRHYALNTSRPFKDTIEILVHEFPMAAHVRNFEGHFPLHLALCEGRRTWKTGVASLIKASIEPLQRRERRTGLYPFQLAAMSAAYPCGESAEEALETIFQLLLACPHVLNWNHNKRFAR
ncbi:ankyrin repeat domain protein [Nitzschia inconspicua]|uniref:Ankyrin repeat domain protein n=1 Tax=Nitzschia inconspicua TaxID=303405 RepID=A0A9K3L5Z2_9STRA|nr:ankyrin repeat domain protein [Nitzschia inconspicua]